MPGPPRRFANLRKHKFIRTDVYIYKQRCVGDRYSDQDRELAGILLSLNTKADRSKINDN